MGEQTEEETIEIFDLSADVVLADLSDESLLFRESIIKTFFEIANRTSKAVYGFTKDELQQMQNEIIEEFRTRGRDYKVPLDRNSSDSNIERLAGDSLVFHDDQTPQEVKDIANSFFKQCRINWMENHPEDKTDGDIDENSNCEKLAWQEVIAQGWFQDNNGQWKKRGEDKIHDTVRKSKTKDFFRFVSDGEVRLRSHEFVNGKCEYCVYFHNARCNVLEHLVLPSQVCDAYSGSYFYDDSERKYVIENFGRFMAGLIKKQPMQNMFVRMIDAPVGIIMIFRDSMPLPHYFSITLNEFVEITTSKHHWSQTDVDTISGSGGFGHE